MWYKSEVLLGTTWELSEHIGKMMGTRGKSKKILRRFLPRKEKTGPLMSPC
jgi:hypothetical protein